MCGFMVILGKSPKEITPSFKKLVHRGHDDEQLLGFSGGTIGFHRLSIMDLSNHGRQPFKLPSGNILVCNGEIYNYQKV